MYALMFLSTIAPFRGLDDSSTVFKSVATYYEFWSSFYYWEICSWKWILLLLTWFSAWFQRHFWRAVHTFEVVWIDVAYAAPSHIRAVVEPFWALRHKKGVSKLATSVVVVKRCIWVTVIKFLFGPTRRPEQGANAVNNILGFPADVLNPAADIFMLDADIGKTSPRTSRVWCETRTVHFLHCTVCSHSVERTVLHSIFRSVRVKAEYGHTWGSNS